MGKYAEAKKMATKLLDSCPPKYGQDISKLIDILSQWIVFKEKYELIEIFDTNQAVLIQPFKVQHRLCKFYPCLKFQYQGAD